MLFTPSHQLRKTTHAQRKTRDIRYKDLASFGVEDQIFCIQGGVIKG